MTLTGPEPGATRPQDPRWLEPTTGFRRWETSAVIGSGEQHWRRASDAVLRWGVKTASGFSIAGGSVPVRAGEDYLVTAQVGPLRIVEPVRVVAVVETDERVGFAYGTREGHPVAGEEAFVVHRAPDGRVVLTLRSLTRAAPTLPWRPLFPFLLVAQRTYRRRYLRALT